MLYCFMDNNFVCIKLSVHNAELSYWYTLGKIYNLWMERVLPFYSLDVWPKKSNLFVKFRNNLLNWHMTELCIPWVRLLDQSFYWLRIKIIKKNLSTFKMLKMEWIDFRLLNNFLTLWFQNINCQNEELIVFNRYFLILDFKLKIKNEFNLFKNF